MTEPDAIDDAVGVTRMRWGVPTCVTVTAGVGHSGLLTEAEPDAFDRVMRVNARGPWLCMRAWVGAMQERNRWPAPSSPSRASSARLVDRSMGIYCASKAALSMLVQVAAAEWGAARHPGQRGGAGRDADARCSDAGRPRPSRARPGWPAWPSARRWAVSARPSDIARPIIALHAMDWVTGQVLECDGGLVAAQPADPYGAIAGRSSRPGRLDRRHSHGADPGSAGAAWTRRPSQTMASRSQAGAAPAWAVAWQVAPTSETTASASRRRAPRRRPAPAAAARRWRRAGRPSPSAAASSNSTPAPMTATIRSRLAAPSSTTWVEEAEEGRRRVVGVGQRLGVDGQRRQPIEQDGLAELLLGREVAVERPHAHAGLLGDQVDRDLDPLDGEDVLGGLEDAGPVALGVGPQRARRDGGRLVTPCLYRSASRPQKSLLPRLTNGTLGSV